jgi:Predicted periplasmic protein (DUF2092)
VRIDPVIGSGAQVIKTELFDQGQVPTTLKNMKFKIAAAVCGAVTGVVFALNGAFAADSKTTPTQITSPVQAPAPVPRVAPLADKLLTQTCKVLGAANAFSFHAEVLFDQVLPPAVKVQFAGGMNFALQRPGDLAVDYRSDLGAKQLWYQNGELTIFDPPHMVYARRYHLRSTICLSAPRRITIFPSRSRTWLIVILVKEFESR